MKGIIETVRGEALLLFTALKREGFAYVLREGLKYVFSWPVRIGTVFWLRMTRSKVKFTYAGREYSYLYHSYNSTWENDRAMEIPIAWDIVRQSKDKRVLEIGNVLKHYYDCHHDVVDLWERYPGVINIDILDFNPVQKYDLVISVSTFEHIGWDEKPRRPEKLLPAVDHVLQHVLAPGGKFIMTVPLGYNRALDRFLFNENLPFTRIDCMRQVESRHNLWEMSPWESILQNEFSANGEWLGKVKTNLICTITAPHG